MRTLLVSLSSLLLLSFLAFIARLCLLILSIRARCLKSQYLWLVTIVNSSASVPSHWFLF